MKPGLPVNEAEKFLTEILLEQLNRLLEQGDWILED